MISLNNGNTYTAVEDMSDEQIGEVLSSCSLDQEIADACMGRDDKEWLFDYATKHVAKHGSHLIIG